MIVFYKIQYNNTGIIKLEPITKDQMVLFVNKYNKSYNLDNINERTSNSEIMLFLRKMPGCISQVSPKNKVCSFAYWIDLTPKTNISKTEMLAVNGGITSLKTWYTKNFKDSKFEDWIKI